MAHKNILMSFLNSVLGRAEGEKIIEVIINDPHNVTETPLSKESIVDVRCTDQKKHQYIIEMQMVSQKEYAARAQYYSALALGRQLNSGEQYFQLVPVIFVGILNFSLFKNQNYISHHFIVDNETHEQELKHLEFHFIELPKFDKQVKDLTNILDKWLYFLKHAVSLEEIPASLTEKPLTEAFDILKRGSWSKGDLEAYERYLDAMRSAVGQLAAAEEKGIEKGKEQQAIAIAKQLFDLLDIETISQKTGLSIDKIKKLKTEDKK